jgi:ACS family tartrate transporter-like MFS transporter
MFLLYIVSYLDRINVGFAALQLNTALGFSSTVFGTGAGIFFIGYFILEVPSNLIMERTGARIWIARILITWGIISSAMMFIRGPASFYVLRFLLGAAEAGFFPGMILYLTYWFPAEERGHAVARFMTATAIAGVIGGPVSGVLLRMDNLWNLAGWQWLFLLEGLPAVFLGFVTLAILPDRPNQAKWLSVDERNWLAERIRHEQSKTRTKRHLTFRDAIASRSVWLLSLMYFLVVMNVYGVSLWLPQIVQNLSSAGSLLVGFVTAVPYTAAAIGMTLIGRSSDRTAERRWHFAASAILGAAGMALSASSQNTVAVVAALSLAAVGIWGTMGPFWAMSSDLLTGTAAAAGIALINSVGNLGGFLGPYMLGWLRDRTQSFAAGMFVLAFLLGVASMLAVSRGEPGVRSQE